MVGNLKNRLAKVEQEVATIDKEEKQAKCICHAFVGIGPGRVEQFKVEMNRLCPAHGFRELKILHFFQTEPVGPDRFTGCRIARNAEVDDLLQDSHCSALTKKGMRCRAAATSGGLCFFHANPRKAAELGRIGGRKNGRVMRTSDPLPSLETVAAVRDTVKRLINDVYDGKLNPRTAAGLAPLLQLQMRAIEKTDFEERLARAEKELMRLKADLENSEGEKRDQVLDDSALGKRPPQAVKPYASDDSKIAG